MAVPSPPPAHGALAGIGLLPGRRGLHGRRRLRVRRFDFAFGRDRGGLRLAAGGHGGAAGRRGPLAEPGGLAAQVHLDPALTLG